MCSENLQYKADGFGTYLLNPLDLFPVIKMFILFYFLIHDLCCREQNGAIDIIFSSWVLLF